jgi:hypothetical protein
MENPSAARLNSTFQSIGLTLAAAAAISTGSPLSCGAGALPFKFQLLRPAEVLMRHHCPHRLSPHVGPIELAGIFSPLQSEYAGSRPRLHHDPARADRAKGSGPI